MPKVFLQSFGNAMGALPPHNTSPTSSHGKGMFHFSTGLVLPTSAAPASLLPQGKRTQELGNATSVCFPSPCLQQEQPSGPVGAGQEPALPSASLFSNTRLHVSSPVPKQLRAAGSKPRMLPCPSTGPWAGEALADPALKTLP